ncbi:SDR family NAD(P)-dependent oxidoreductase [Deinococcus cavernae]|uniref:SDR family NAD(P)-dependent oxidoreductase n=2 Tax=Deinococcus cavernae TaxID=2320857 RepID=A0A418VA02_9DEIO|nr:SDR family NAD(P)-dependent oxidoreductase [Deinococcus cavernae]
MLGRLLLSPPACRDIGRVRARWGGRTVLVTGASAGIGREVAWLLGLAGARVLLLARSKAELQQVAHQIRAHGGEAEVLVADLSKPDQVEAAINDIKANHARLDAVVSNAGRSIRRSAFKAAEKRDLERSLAVNFTGPAALLLGLLPLCRPGTVLVNVSTVSARPPAGPRWGAYQGSKAGFDVWFQALGAEIQVSGVRCASVYLPLTRTRMSAPTYHPSTPALSAREAAESVVYALVRPVTRVAPWWLGWQELAALAFPGLFRRLFGLVARWDKYGEKT